MRSFLSIAFAFLFAATAFAQPNYGETPEDQEACKKNLSLYQGFYKQKNYKDALRPWWKVIDYCPKFSKALYQKGARMYGTFAKEAKKADDSEKMGLYADSILMVHKLRIEHYGEEGKVKGLMGTDLLKYNKDKFEEAHGYLMTCLEMEGDKMEPAAIASLFSATYKMVKADKLEKTELYNLYPRLSDICDNNINALSKKAAAAADEKKKDKLEGKIEGYKSSQANLDKIFMPVAKPEDLDEILTPQFEAAPTDTNLLKKIVKLYIKKDATDRELYEKALVNLDKEQPSAQSKFHLGKFYSKKDMWTEALGYYEAAAEMAEDGVPMKEEAYLKAAQAAYNLKQLSKVRQHCNKVISINPNSGDAYLLIGDAYASSKVGDNACTQKSKYWVAVDKYARAKSVDPSVADKANKKIGQASGQFPKKSECFFHSMNDGDSYTVGGWINETTTVRTIAD